MTTASTTLQRVLYSAILFVTPVATAQTTFDLDRTSAVTAPVGAVGGELLTEGFPGPPTVAIPNVLIGLQAGDDIDVLSFGDDNEIAGLHVIVFSVDPRSPASWVVAGPGGSNFERTTGTAPSNPTPGPNPAEAAGDLFVQMSIGGGACSNMLAPAGFGYSTGSATGDESDISLTSPNILYGPADDVDAFEFSAPATAMVTGIYFSLTPTSTSVQQGTWSPGDILYSPLNGSQPTVAVLGGSGLPATDANLGIAGLNLDALNCVAQSAGVIAAGPVGATPCSISRGSHLLEFSISDLVSPYVLTPSDVLGVEVFGSGPSGTGFLVSASQLGLCSTVTGCGNWGEYDNLNALEASSGSPPPPPPPPGPLPTVGTTFDHDHGIAITPVGGAGDLLTEGFPGSPTVAITDVMIGLMTGDEINALSFGDDFLIAQHHEITFSVDSLSMGVPASGVNGERFVGTAPSVPLPGPNAAEACGDLFSQILIVPGTCTDIVAPPGLGYAANTGTGDEFNATWATPNFFGSADDLDAFDYSPAATALTTGIYFSLAPGSPSLTTLPACAALPAAVCTPGDILYSPLGGGPVTLATLAGTGLPATAANLGIPSFLNGGIDLDLDALNLIAAAPGVIAAGLVGPTPCSGGGGSHQIEFSISYTLVPGFPFFPADVLGVFGPGAAGVLTPAASLGLCTHFVCDVNDNLNALEDSSGGKPPLPDDSDGDGVPDWDDVCPGGDDNADSDADGVPDFCDPCPADNPDDGDVDGLCDSDDNCPDHSNPDQADCDDDGIGDVCAIADGNSSDDDGNGVPDECENAPDIDGDGDVDAADLAQLLGSWGPTGDCPPYVPADFDHDCDVDAADLAQLLGAWGP